MTPPSYPGHGAICNGCGLCCLHSPCPLSAKAGLWRQGHCVALKATHERYLCEAIAGSWRFQSLGGSTLAQREQMTAVAEGMCSYRAAFTDEEAEALLAKPNTLAPGHPVQVVRYWSDGTTTTLTRVAV